MKVAMRRFGAIPTVVDCFSGAGGLSEGFKQEGFELLLGIDMDKFAVSTFERNHGKALQCNIENLTSNRIRKEIGSMHITVMTAGPPCQAFSSVGIPKLKSLKKSITRNSPLNKLYQEFLRLVHNLSPSFFVIENVGRMFTMADGAIKNGIESQLKGKYNVNFYYEKVADFGVPQLRRRGLAIGNCLGIPNPILKPTHFNSVKVGTVGKKPYVNVRDAIADLPHLKAAHGSEVMDYQKKNNLSKYQKERRRNSKKIHNHTSRFHSPRDLKIFKKLKPGQTINDLPARLNPYRHDIFLDKYKKQPWNKPASTILAHLSKDGLMFIHPDGRQNRSLTPREAARLQSFNDTFVFEGPRTEQFLQVGNAVPPLFARAIARSILDSLSIKCKKAVSTKR